MKWIYLIAIVITIASCKQSKQETVEETVEVAPETVTIVGQFRPDSEHKEFDMPIDKGLDKLEFVDPANVELDSTDLVIGIPLGDIQLAIPLTYLEGFEVANLEIDKDNYLITWCPLVGSSRIFEGNLEGDTAGFDFGRGLVNNNLLIVDRKTRSVWNQLSRKAITGDHKGDKLTPLPTIQSTWSFWKKKYPETKLLINRDTTGAVFPSVVFENPHYNTWEPEKGRYETTSIHQADNLGLGIEMGDASVYFPFSTLFEMSSPISYQLNEKDIKIHFDQSGLTAWAEDAEGNMLPSAIVYNWAWKNFFPDTEVFEQ